MSEFIRELEKNPADQQSIEAIVSIAPAGSARRRLPRESRTRRAVSLPLLI